MAKVPTSVIGVDLGRYALKSVLMQRRGNRFVVTNCASRVLEAPVDDAENLGRELKVLLKELGGSAKVCAVGVSSPDAIIRIIEQPETPTHMLRDGLRLNGIALLNQDVKEFVLDCDKIPAATGTEPVATGGVSRQRYLVGGLPRTHVTQVGEAFEKSSTSIGAMQLAPVCNFNAFEFAHEEIFNNHAFFLVDIGHVTSTVMVGMKRELVMVRTIDFGGHALIEALGALSGEERDSVLRALNALVREIQSSIGFLEHQREQQIDRIFVSGGAAKSHTLLKVLSEELSLPTEAWSAVGKCENALSAEQAAGFENGGLDFNVACGAAAELLKGN
jgi:Tfp pilus assembly PilM family ATPase